MINIELEMQGRDNVYRKFWRLSNTLQDVGVEGIDNIANKIIMSAKARAPVGFSGELRKSIRRGVVEHSSEGGKKITSIGIRAGSEKVKYAAAQEFGFTPHYVPRRYMIDWIFHKGGFPSSRFYVVRKHTSFIGPAVEAVRPYVAEVAKGIPLKALRRAGFKGGKR